MQITLNPHWVAGVTLHGTDWLVVALILVWLLLAEPLLGRTAYLRFLAALKRDGKGARARFYRHWTWQGWVLAMVVLALALGVLGWTPEQLGLRLPQWSIHVTARVAWPFVAGVVLALAVGVLLGMVLSRRKQGGTPKRDAPRMAGNPEVLQMLPRTSGERRGFALLSITAGITEEIIWRGFVLALLVAAMPRVPMAVDIILIAAIFGWAHLYQGVAGIFATGMLGAVMTVLYLLTGSLLVSIVLHAAIDLVAMLRTPRQDDATKGSATTGDLEKTSLSS